VISFAIGASIVTLFLWIMRYAYHVNRTGSFVKGFEALPSFHVRVMWLAGGTAGTLWSIGNICSMISVEYLGEGVGYSVVQVGVRLSTLCYHTLICNCCSFIWCVCLLYFFLTLIPSELSFHMFSLTFILITDCNCCHMFLVCHVG